MGSVGKGYAVEMVCQAAQARGLTSALVSVGGNLLAIGKKPDGSQWTGGVENPWNASEVYTTDSLFGAAINMSDMALVTSGDYQRYFVVDGKRYHHLIDPDTLWPAAYFNSVTVLCPDSGMADCLTTGLFCMPLEEGQKLVESLGEPHPEVTGNSSHKQKPRVFTMRNTRGFVFAVSLSAQRPVGGT